MNQKNKSKDFPTEKINNEENYFAGFFGDDTALLNKNVIDINPAAIPVVDDFIALQNGYSCKNINAELPAQFFMRLENDFFASETTEPNKKSSPNSRQNANQNLIQNIGDVSRDSIIYRSNTHDTSGVYQNKRATVDKNQITESGDGFELKTKDAYYNCMTMVSKLPKDETSVDKEIKIKSSEQIHDVDIKTEGEKIDEKYDDKNQIIENKFTNDIPKRCEIFFSQFITKPKKPYDFENYSTVRASENDVSEIVVDLDSSFIQDDVSEYSSSDDSVSTFLEEGGTSADIYTQYESSKHFGEDVKQQTEYCSFFEGAPYNYAAKTPARLKTDCIDMIIDDDYINNDPTARFLSSLSSKVLKVDRRSLV